MDLSRSSSSVYSNDNNNNNIAPNRASTYLDYRSNLSVDTQHARSLSSSNGSSTPRRTHTPTPSYMNYQSGAAAKAAAQSPATPRPTIVPKVTPPKPPAPSRLGILLLAFAAEPHPSTLRTVERLMKARSFSSIAILAETEQEHSVKELKINLFSLIGQMQIEMAINIYLCDGWNEASVTGAVEAATNDAGLLRSVLCSPAYGTFTADTNILDLPSSSFERSWTTSFVFLHALAKASFSRLVSPSSTPLPGGGTSHNSLKTSRQGADASQFVILNPKNDCPAAQVSRAACDALLTQLSQSFATSGIVVGPVEQLLPPERKPLTSSGKQPGKGNGLLAAAMPGADPMVISGGTQQQIRAFDGMDEDGEGSPTALYSMWALREQFDGDSTLE